MTTPETSKRKLQELVDKLDRLRDGTAPEVVIDNAFVDALSEWLGPAENISEEANCYATTRLRKVLDDEKIIQSVRRDQLQQPEKTTLGELLNDVRRKANWDLPTMAAKLGVDVSVIERLERDLVPLVELGVEQIADILEVFRVRFAEFARLAERTGLLQQTQHDVATSYARPNTDEPSDQHGHESAFALARMLPDLDRERSESKIDKALLEGVSSELRRRERFDLLSD